SNFEERYGGDSTNEVLGMVQELLPEFCFVEEADEKSAQEKDKGMSPEAMILKTMAVKLIAGGPSTGMDKSIPVAMHSRAMALRIIEVLNQSGEEELSDKYRSYVEKLLAASEEPFADITFPEYGVKAEAGLKGKLMNQLFRLRLKKAAGDTLIEITLADGKKTKMSIDEKIRELEGKIQNFSHLEGESVSFAPEQHDMCKAFEKRVGRALFGKSLELKDENGKKMRAKTVRLQLEKFETFLNGKIAQDIGDKDFVALQRLNQYAYLLEKLCRNKLDAKGVGSIGNKRKYSPLLKQAKSLLGKLTPLLQQRSDFLAYDSSPLRANREAGFVTLGEVDTPSSFTLESLSEESNPRRLKPLTLTRSADFSEVSLSKSGLVSPSSKEGKEFVGELCGKLSKNIREREGGIKSLQGRLRSIVSDSSVVDKAVSTQYEALYGEKTPKEVVDQRIKELEETNTRLGESQGELQAEIAKLEAEIKSLGSTEDAKDLIEKNYLSQEEADRLTEEEVNDFIENLKGDLQKGLSALQEAKAKAGEEEGRLATEIKQLADMNAGGDLTQADLLFYDYQKQGRFDNEVSLAFKEVFYKEVDKITTEKLKKKAIATWHLLDMSSKAMQASVHEDFSSLGLHFVQPSSDEDIYPTEGELKKGLEGLRGVEVSFSRSLKVDVERSSKAQIRNRKSYKDVRLEVTYDSKTGALKEECKLNKPAKKSFRSRLPGFPSLRRKGGDVSEEKKGLLSGDGSEGKPEMEESSDPKKEATDSGDDV
ncbi:hypothetical protein SCG7109_AM_00010, partial [Chlamydiales bacterium SCGC AG-110-M15]